MPKHGQNSRLGWAWPIGRWLVFCAAMVGIAAGEADRIAGARATVASGWAPGIVAGAGGGLALAALLAVTILVQRQRQRRWSRSRPQAILILTIALLLLFAVLTSTPPRQYGPAPVPYVITSGFEVAEI